MPIVVPMKAANYQAIRGTVIAACVALTMAGCGQSAPKLSISAGSGSIPSQAPEQPTVPPAEKAAAEKQAIRSALLARAEAEPKDVRRTIAASRALKAEGRIADALQLAERSLAVNEKDPVIVREAGLLALDAGQPAKAEKHLRRAVELGSTEWQTRSAFGAALATQGKHAEAQLQLAKALEAMPDHPAILNNLALSYVLDNKPAEAESVLRIAANKSAAPRHVQHNLALVLGVRGKTAEAERVATAASSPAKASANVAYLKALSGERAQAGQGPSAIGPSSETPLKAASVPALTEKPFMLGGSGLHEKPE